MTDEFPSRSPIDGGVLGSLRDRASTHPLVKRFEPERSNEAIVALRLVFDSDRYPETVAEATLTIRWFENGEYSFHHRERRGEGSSGTWQCRWDKHPNPHAAYAHFHRPPDADAGDVVDDPIEVTHPSDVFGRTLANVRERIASLWERK